MGLDMVYHSIVEPLHEHCDIVQDRIEEILDRAVELYGADTVNCCSSIDIQYYEKGRNAAIAAIRKTENSDPLGLLQFSMELVRKNLEIMVTEIVPHEISHIICMGNSLDNGHGPVWKEMCRALGGSGDRCHRMIGICGRLTSAYEAITPFGGTVWLTKKQLNIVNNTTGYYVRDIEEREFYLTKDSLTGIIMRL